MMQRIRKRFNTLFTRIIPTLILLFSLFSTAYAASFVVKDIRVTGLKRISLGTVLNYLPIRVGERLDDKNTGNLIRSLYDTGFFDSVELDKQGNTLIIKVVERPTIGSISVTGNKEIKKEQLNNVLKEMGLVEGHVFDRSMLEAIEQELKTQYYSRGKYNAKIETTETKLPRNRIGISITISEGLAAKIKEINIIGNKAFETDVLRKQFALSKSGLFTLFSQRDQYSKAKLDASLEALRSYYMDRGYIKFAIQSTQVSLTPDRKHVYVTIKVKEGPLYHVKAYALSGKLILEKDKIESLIHVKKGDVFSRRDVTDSVSSIGEALGDEGYGFPNINAHPEVDEKDKTVFITFMIDPGRRVYVRRINFSGNIKTADQVLRREMRQNEGALISVSKIKESQRRLRLLGYLKDVGVKTVPVPGTNNQVDLDYHVTEAPSATISASVGFSTDGFLLNAAMNQPNFMGTGKSVGVNFQTSKWGRSYSFTYFNPYYTLSGVGRGVNVYYQKTTPGKLDITGYTTNKIGGEVNYSIPLSENNKIQLGYGYQHMELRLGSSPPSQTKNFVNAFGRVYNQARLYAGWSYNSYDQVPFPNSGYNQQFDSTIVLPGASKHLNYFKVGYTAKLYQPLYHGFILTTLGSIGFGNGFAGTAGLPFFDNYYAGGIAVQGRVRGYESYSLGPKDDKGEPLGGNFLVSASTGLIFPYPLSRDNIRTSIFGDAGNVYSIGLPKSFRGTKAGRLRFSAGVEVDWRSPVGPLAFSLAKAIKPLPGDKEELFQFTIASGF